MHIELNPTVCLDGSAVRRIREEKRLTQLYVAKVIGVTTDTISRWENNRYPSIKRDNALALAEALEVPLDEILQKPAAEPQSAGPKKTKLPLFISLLVGLLLLIVAGFFILGNRAAPPAEIAAERLLPPHAAPGSIVPVRVLLSIDAGMKGVILREHFPPGWKLIEANPPASSLDNEEGVARWILKQGESGYRISYLLRVGSGAAIGSRGEFQGDAVANRNGNSSPAPVSGADGIQVAPFLWADTNGDGVVDDGEMLQASDLFDEMHGVHLDWKQLETIWDAGSYQWDERSEKFFPGRQ